MKAPGKWVLTAFAVCGLMPVWSLFGEDSGFLLEYRFKAGEPLHYLIEIQDSLLISDDAGTRASVSFIRIEQSVRMLNNKAGKGFRIAVSTDSLWERSDEGDPLNLYEKMIFELDFASFDDSLEIDTNGDVRSKNPICIPFFIPLPKTRVQVDASWDFTMKTIFQDSFDGNALTTGNCLLYKTMEEDGDSIAVLAVRIERSNNAKKSVQDTFQALTDLVETSETGIGAVYFNISRNVMEKGVIRWFDTVHMPESGGDRMYKKKTRMTFRLMSVQKTKPFDKGG